MTNMCSEPELFVILLHILTGYYRLDLAVQVVSFHPH